MTTRPRTLGTPRLEARTFAVGVTAASSHPSGLADLANDAASGHPGQRMTVGRLAATGVYSTHWIPTEVPRWLRVEALFTSSAVTTANGVTLKLQVDDGSFTVVYTDPEIPAGLQGDVPHISFYSTSTPSRLGAGQRVTWLLDIDALVAAGLSLSAAVWRFQWSAVVTSPGEVELITVDEVPRFVVDSAESFGQLPGSYLPRGIVADGTPAGLQRLWATVRTGLMLGLRTYHSTVRPEADAWLCTSTSFVSFGGSDEESAGVPAKHRVRPRAMRPGVDTRVKYLIRYKLAGAVALDTATVRLTTGAGNYDVTLTDVSGAWAESAFTTAYLLAGAEDTIEWKALVSNGASTLHVIARPVFDYPEA